MAENDEGYATIIISRDEAERLSWMAGECWGRMRKLHQAYFEAVET